MRKPVQKYSYIVVGNEGIEVGQAFLTFIVTEFFTDSPVL